MVRTIVATILLLALGSGVSTASESYKPSKSSVKQRTEQIYQKIWQANADLFEGGKKPGFYFHVIAHELAHIDKPPQWGGLISLLNGCEFKVPDFELMGDAIGRKRAMRAGFKGVLGSYERACNVTEYFSADMAKAQQQ
ncbi:MAG: hypothetical protein ISN29_06450 [Gammaproteobacteria bacterium AqS3]|nr:hypothetical protein [Gammaproteobacteria bacterium AqS3]